jgi:signal transduction histidine kinase
MNLSKAFTQQPRGWIFTEMMALLLVIGLLDFFSGYEIRLLPFYAAPIFGVAWFCGMRAGILAACFSSLIWWSTNWFTGDPDLHSWMRVWETSRHVGFFLVVAWTGSALRAKSALAGARITLLERARRLEREIVSITEAEQRRIGRDLHDGLCQYLAALRCAAASLRDDLQSLQLRAEANMAAELADHLREAVVQTRDLAHGLVPAHVNQVGLVLALESLAQSVSQLQEVTCTFRLKGRAPDCDEHTAIDLYRIAQEAINNATRHGAATKINISLEAVGDLMTLGVLDDGVGFIQSDSDGMGLKIMRYRARSNGGELRIERHQSGGTMVSCTARANYQESEIAAV